MTGDAANPQTVLHEVAPRGSALKANVTALAEGLRDAGQMQVTHTVAELILLLAQAADNLVALEAELAINAGRVSPEQIEALFESGSLTLRDMPDGPPET